MVLSPPLKTSNNLTLYSGCGNLFFIYDGSLGLFPIAEIPSLCEDAGVDGLIVLGSSKIAHYSMQIFNADGGVACMCGNGIRCLMRYLIDRGAAHAVTTIETAAGVLEAWQVGDEIAVNMSEPEILNWNLTVDLGEYQLTGSHLNTGVPHFVVFIQNLTEIDVPSLGAQIHALPQFRMSNINFAKVDQEICHLRTYERGVNDETAACGTGATAVALAAHHHFGLPSPLICRFSSGEELTISFKKDFKHLVMQGKALKLSSVEDIS